MVRMFDLVSPHLFGFCGRLPPLLLAQQGDSDADEARVVWALLVLVALGLVLAVTLLLFLLLGGSRRARLLAEEAERKRRATETIDAWEESGRRFEPDSAEDDGGKHG
jgi:hypothetical protein